MGLKGIRIDGTNYQFDHDYLDNLPTVDASPAEGSTNAVQSGGVYSALATKADASMTYTKTEVDTALAAKAPAATTYTKTEVDTALGLKANVADVYTQSQINTALSAKADASTTYTKTEVDAALDLKAPAAATYTKTEVDTALSGKADTATTYTKTEVDTALSGKADASATYTKTETDTALAAKQDTLTFDSTPTSGSTNPVTSGGVYTALQSAGVTQTNPDWDQDDETAADYVKNRPFYRTITVPHTINRTFSLTAGDGEYYTSYYERWGWLGASTTQRVTLTRGSYTQTDILTGTTDSDGNRVFAGDGYRVVSPSGGGFTVYIDEDFGGTTETTLGVKLEHVSIAYERIPEEYIDTSFAAPSFTGDGIASGTPSYGSATVLFRYGGQYYVASFADAFTNRLAASGLSSDVSGLQDTVDSLNTALTSLQGRVSTLESANATQAETISSMQSAITSLTARVAYLESLHGDDSGSSATVTGTELDLGTDATLTDGVLDLGTTATFVDGELVFESGGSSGSAELSDGELTLTSASVSDGELDLGTSAAVTDGELSVGSG